MCADQIKFRANIRQCNERMKLMKKELSHLFSSASLLFFLSFCYFGESSSGMMCMKNE